MAGSVYAAITGRSVGPVEAMSPAEPLTNRPRKCALLRRDIGLVIGIVFRRFLKYSSKLRTERRKQ